MNDRPRGRVAPPPAPAATLPPLALRSAISDAVHHAVVTVLEGSRVHWADGSGACAWYAATAARLCAALFDRDYTINVGTFRLQTSTRDGGWGFAMDAANPLIPNQEFHAVAIGRPPGPQGEVIDLASRHWRTWADRLGARWDAPEPPPFVWCLQRDLRDAWPLGISYVAHPASTNRLIQFLSNDGASVVTELVQLATVHLAQSEAGQAWAEKTAREGR